MKMKIKKELKDFTAYKKEFIFNQKKITQIEDICYCDGEILCQGQEKTVGEAENWINVGYKLKGAYSKVLSNLFPYQFVFRGKKLNSIEAFFQCIKFKNKEAQNYVLRYSGLDSNNIKIVNDYNWKETCVIYWQNKPINRTSNEYNELIDELYISAIQNPLYRSALVNCTKDIIHSIGEEELEKTVFTRYEFEYQLNCLKSFLQRK